MPIFCIKNRIIELVLGSKGGACAPSDPPLDSATGLIDSILIRNSYHSTRTSSNLLFSLHTALCLVHILRLLR